MDFVNSPATFIIPHWQRDSVKSKINIDNAIEGIFKQTDDNWRIIIIDGCSPSKEAREYLKELSDQHPDRIQVILEEKNNGIGPGRNLGIRQAFENQSPIILFNDADDISNYKRLEVVRKLFIEKPEIGVVYSTFKVIDEFNNYVADEDLTPSILEIIESHQNNPPQGRNVWIEIGTRTGCTNLTSSTSVRTELAHKYPFPNTIVSEDQHTWYRYAADEMGSFAYVPTIPSLYRIPTNSKSASRSRISGFYRKKAEADTDGFKAAIEIALMNGSIQMNDKDELLIKFYLKLAETIVRENENDLALEIIGEARIISESKTKYYLDSGVYKIGEIYI